MRPGTIAIYGRTKIGKTVDVNRCFRKAITIETERGATTSVLANLGYEPPRVECFSVDEPYEEVARVVEKTLPEAIKKLGATAVVLDTGSELADRIFVNEDAFWNHDGRQAYPQTGIKFKTLLRRILMLNVWVVALFHEREEKTSSQGKHTRGGPKLPGSLVEDTPGMFDLILHATLGASVGATGTDSTGMGSAPTVVKRVYRCDGLDSKWVCGDRFNAALREQPMDLRPIMYRILNSGQEPQAELLESWGLQVEDFKR